MSRSRLTAWAGAMLAVLLATSSAAANSQRVGDLVVHYNAVPSAQLTPEIARQYGITRSANRALVNVAVRRGQPGADVAVPASVTVAVTNPNGQRSNPRVREVREGEAIYYLAQASHAGTDTLDFEIEVVVEGLDEPVRVTFRQEFFPR